MYGKLKFLIFYTRMITCIGWIKIVAKIVDTKIMSKIYKFTFYKLEIYVCWFSNGKWNKKFQLIF